MLRHAYVPRGAALLVIALSLVLLGPVVPSSSVQVDDLPPGALAAVRDIPSYRGSSYDGQNWAAPDRVATFLDTEGELGIAFVDPAAEQLTIDTHRTSDLAQVGTRTLSYSGWSQWGGFYAAPDGHYYVLVGRTNPNHLDNRVVIAVRRYDAAWNLVGTATVKGGGGADDGESIAVPFDGSAPSMLLAGSKLVIHTARELFNGHQTNLTIEVDTTTMTAARFVDAGRAGVSASHSFNQFASLDGDNLLLLDHGDTYPRAVQLGMVEDYPATGVSATTHEIFKFLGEEGDNYTGTAVTGMEAGPQGALVIGHSVPHGQPVQGVTGTGEDLKRNVFAISADPATGDTDFTWLTDLSPTGNRQAQEPRLVRVGDDRFVLLFSVLRGSNNIGTEYRLVDSGGSLLASASWPGHYFAPIADPVLAGDQLLWIGGESVGGTGAPETAYLYGLDIADPTEPTLLTPPDVETVILSFDSTGGDPVDARSVESGRQVGALPRPERDGFRFQGWFTEATGGSRVTAQSTFTSDTTLYARWRQLSADAGLVAIDVARGRLKPSFTQARTHYRVLVTRGRPSVTLTPQRSSSNAALSFRIGKRPWQSGKQIKVSVSPRQARAVTIRVRSEDRSTLRAYTVKVKRKR